MHHFTIRDVENLSGIKAHTLRIWEQRYGLCFCKRKQSLHRYYDNEDLQHILRIAYLYHNGYRISAIAKLSPEEIIAQASKNVEHTDSALSVSRLLEASMDYNRQLFETILQAAIGRIGLEKSIEKLIYPFMNKLGLLWVTGHVLPAQEHFCSHLVQNAILAATQALPAFYNGPHCYLLFTPEGEDHELPLLYMQYLLKKKGVSHMLLGKNASLDLVQDCCSQKQVSHLYFHLITNFIHCPPAKYLQQLGTRFASQRIIASGPALKEVQQAPGNIRILRSLQEITDFCPAE